MGLLYRHGCDAFVIYDDGALIHDFKARVAGTGSSNDKVLFFLLIRNPVEYSQFRIQGNPIGFHLILHNSELLPVSSSDGQESMLGFLECSKLLHSKMLTYFFSKYSATTLRSFGISRCCGHLSTQTPQSVQPEARCSSVRKPV